MKDSAQAKSKAYEIFIAEANPADVLLVREALRISGLPANLHVLKDGEQAVKFIDRAEKDRTLPNPELFVLDLNMPRINGDEVLAHIRQSSRFADTPVVVLSSSQSPADALKSKSLGARRHLRKPSDYDQFMLLGGVMKEVLSEHRQ